ncbi:c-type cytochrome [Aquitalea sp. LB_tupeE]|uniref:c-type cytochrome n=1 Tax=Aquitalea sp. LB_tupeE TaxID=2748078 RepID=UPI0015BE4CD3|nr:c-type cytochrome [Aquitalea sp. LB_tupeE]NWK78904.1 c-type cytochrome [Aquitalea sp. LB_tupeE]
MKHVLIALALCGTVSASLAQAASGPELAKQYNCLACHSVDAKLVGPSYKQVAAKYKGQDVTAKLMQKVKAGGSGSFGAIPMSPNPQVPDADLKQLVTWILAQ